MRHTSILSLLLLVTSLVHAQRITVSFRDTPLAQALTQIGKLQHEYDIVAIHDDLARYTATADIVDATVPEAVGQLIECYPLRMTVGDGRVVYVEAPYRDYVHYRGTVLDRDGHPLPYVNVTLYHPVDTTLQAQAPSSNSGLFVIPSRQESALLRFTHIAHDTLWLHADTPDLGNIQLRPRLQPLDTVSIQPAQASRHTTVRITKAGSLVSLLTPEQQDTITNLVIEGPINSADIRLLRRMAGYREHESDKAGRLRTLDLRNARITSDKKPYLIIDGAEEGLMLEAIINVAHTNVPTPPERYGKYVNGPIEWYDIRYIIRNDMVRNKHVVYRKEHYGYKNKEDVRIYIGKEDTHEIRQTARSHNMNKAKGHRLKWEKENVLMYAYLQDNVFPMDLFYDCPVIDAICVPESAKINDNVLVLHDPIRYYQFNKKGIKLRLELDTNIR